MSPTTSVSGFFEREHEQVALASRQRRREQQLLHVNVAQPSAELAPKRCASSSTMQHSVDGVELVAATRQVSVSAHEFGNDDNKSSCG